MVSTRIKRNLKFSQKEKLDSLLTSTVIAFVLFFLFVKLIWMQEEVSVSFIIFKLIMLWIISTTLIFSMVYIAKITAIKLGYTADYVAWKNGLLIGFVISFVSYGMLPMLFPGLITITRIERHRHGKMFPGENKREISKVLLSALGTLLLISFISNLIYYVSNIEFFYYIMSASALILFFATIPVTNNIGLHLFYTKKTWFFLIFFFSLFFAIFTLFKMFFAILLAIILALIVFQISKKILKLIGLV